MALKLLKRIGSGPNYVKIYRDSDYDQFVSKYYQNNKLVGEGYVPFNKYVKSNVKLAKYDAWENARFEIKRMRKASHASTR